MDESGEFQQFALKYLDSLHNYGRVLTRNETEAEDLLQDTMLRAFRGFASYNRQLSAKIWLLKIMKNAHIDRCRRKLARPMEDELPDESGADPRATEETALAPAPLNPEEILLRRLAIEEVRSAMRRLPAVWRETLELREIEGLSYREIVHVIDRPMGTVMSRLFRGRNRLRSLLRDQPDHAMQPGRPRDL